MNNKKTKTFIFTFLLMIQGCSEVEKAEKELPTNMVNSSLDLELEEFYKEERKKAKEFNFWMGQYLKSPSYYSYHKVMQNSRIFMEEGLDKHIDFYKMAIERTPESEVFDLFLAYFMYKHDNCHIELNRNNLSRYDLTEAYIADVVKRASEYGNRYKKVYALMMIDGVGVKQDIQQGKMLFKDANGLTYEDENCK